MNEKMALLMMSNGTWNCGFRGEGAGSLWGLAVQKTRQHLGNRSFMDQWQRWGFKLVKA
jgi:hypothetical protein